MKIAVITPHCRTPGPWLEQCLKSVARQTVPCTQVVVCDGAEAFAFDPFPEVQVIRLPQPHGDVGNAARAIGSVSAICQGFEALAYLDADNWYEPNHLQLLLALQQRTGAAVCSAARTLYDLEGRLLGPCPEVDGERFVDTNCLLLTRPAFGLVAAWYLMPRPLAEAGDRVLWQNIREWKLTRAHQPVATVNYRTRYAFHYRHFGKEPPPGAKHVVLSAPPAKAVHPPAPDAQPDPTPPEIPSAGPAVARQRVSLCMIVRDEEANLADCLGPVAGLVDEVIVVDTGSTDRTREVAAALGAKVVGFPWQDSFAAARNESLRHATGDWVFWLDADDRLDEDNRRRLQVLLRGLQDENTAYTMQALLPGLQDENRAYTMRQWSAPDQVTGSAPIVDHVRLFRNRPEHRFRYRVHEQILPALEEQGVKVVRTDIVIQHLGYQDALLRQCKLERNLRLLHLEDAENPNDAFTLFNLAGSHLDQGRPDQAVGYLRRCLQAARAGASFLPKAYSLLAQCHRVLGEEVEALRVCEEGLGRFPQQAELWFEQGLLRLARKDLAGAQRCFERILQSAPGVCFASVDAGVLGYRARHNLALLYSGQGRAREAEEQWRRATQECPAFGPAWLGLAELCLGQGRAAEVEAMARLLEGTPAGPGIAPVLRARVCLSRRDVAGARQILEEAITRAPQVLWLRLVLSEVLSREGKDLAAAERHLREVLALDPNQAEARRKLARLRDLQARPAERPGPHGTPP